MRTLVDNEHESDRCDWDWRANTLNPYHEGNSLDAMIDDDRVIVLTKDKWYFGPDSSGDIRNPATIEGLWALARSPEMDPVSMVSAGQYSSPFLSLPLFQPLSPNCL